MKLSYQLSGRNLLEGAVHLTAEFWKNKKKTFVLTLLSIPLLIFLFIRLLGEDAVTGVFAWFMLLAVSSSLMFFLYLLCFRFLILIFRMRKFFRGQQIELLLETGCLKKGTEKSYLLIPYEKIRIIELAHTLCLEYKNEEGIQESLFVTRKAFADRQQEGLFLLTVRGGQTEGGPGELSMDSSKASFRFKGGLDAQTQSGYQRSLVKYELYSSGVKKHVRLFFMNTAFIAILGLLYHRQIYLFLIIINALVLGITFATKKADESTYKTILRKCLFPNGDEELEILTVLYPDSIVIEKGGYRRKYGLHLFRHLVKTEKYLHMIIPGGGPAGISLPVDVFPSREAVEEFVEYLTEKGLEYRELTSSVLGKKFQQIKLFGTILLVSGCIAAVVWLAVWLIFTV